MFNSKIEKYEVVAFLDEGVIVYRIKICTIRTLFGFKYSTVCSYLKNNMGFGDRIFHESRFANKLVHKLNKELI